MILSLAIFLFIMVGNYCYGWMRLNIMRTPLHLMLSDHISVQDESIDTSSDSTNETITIEKQINRTVIYGPDSFGDIMGNTETNTYLRGDFSPMERVVLTANGNLQRILSAYYGAPIQVLIRKCKPSQDTTDIGQCFDREVDLVMGDKVVCRAIGKIQLTGKEYLQAVEEGNIGVGQLFRYLGVLPQFKLLEVGRGSSPLHSRLLENVSLESIELAGHTQLWRRYELSCPQLKCTFIEIFPSSFLEFKPPV